MNDTHCVSKIVVNYKESNFFVAKMKLFVVSVLLCIALVNAGGKSQKIEWITFYKHSKREFHIKVF